MPLTSIPAVWNVPGPRRRVRFEPRLGFVKAASNQAVFVTGPRNGLGIAALVVAIIALISVVGGVVLGIVAVVLGFLGWQRAKRGEATNGGVAIAGIVLGILSIIEALVVIALSVWVFNEVGGTDYMDCLSRAGSDQDAVQGCVDQFQKKVEDQFSVTITTPAPPTP